MYRVTAQYVDVDSGSRGVGRQVSGLYRGKLRWRGVIWLGFESEMMMHLVEPEYIVEAEEVRRRYEL